MPGARRSLTTDQVAALVAEEVFGPSADAHGLGVELEWLTSQGRRDRRLPVSEATALIERLSPLPAGSHLTLEPGGQLELSSAPFRTIDDVCVAAAADLAVLDQACEACQVELIAMGADPLRPPERVAVAPRYQAMERYFDHLGRAGRTMMCNTAAIQVNVGLGEPRPGRAALAAGQPAGTHAHRLLRQLALLRGPAQRLAVQQAAGLVVAGPQPVRAGHL